MRKQDMNRDWIATARTLSEALPYFQRFGGFASGLVVYWIANNTITFTQQYLIMRSQGYKPDLMGNIKGSLGRKPKTDAKK